jgi:hypothetical protein
MEKTLTEAAQLLQKISIVVAMRRVWGTRLSRQPKHNSRMKICAEIFKKATPEYKKEEPIPEKLEEVHLKTRTTPSVDSTKSSETNRRSILSAQSLREFEHIDWVLIDYEEVFDKRALEADFPPKKQVKDSYDLETTSEIFQKLFSGYVTHSRGEKNHGDQA